MVSPLFFLIFLCVCFLFRVKYAILHSCVHHLSEHGKRLVNPLIIIKTKKTFILCIIYVIVCVCVNVSRSLCVCIFFLNLTYNIMSCILFTFIYRRTKLVVLFVVVFFGLIWFFHIFYCYEMYVCVFFSHLIILISNGFSLGGNRISFVSCGVCFLLLWLLLLFFSLFTFELI